MGIIKIDNRVCTMELELINLCEKTILTEKQYIECRSMLLKKISKEKRAFMLNHDKKHIEELRKLRLQLRRLSLCQVRSV